MSHRGLIKGFGINDEPKGCASASKPISPYYSRWKGIIARCYGKEAARRPGYGGCQVSEEWRSFTRFRDWMQQQPWQGNHLDKDILRPWEKLYCPETSVFVPVYINTLMNDCAAVRGDLPTGVTRNARGMPFAARIRLADSKRVGLGVYETAEEAHQAWAKAKSSVIAEVVDRYRTTDRYDERVCAALMDRANQLAKT